MIGNFYITLCINLNILQKHTKDEIMVFIFYHLAFTSIKGKHSPVVVGEIV